MPPDGGGEEEEEGGDFQRRGSCPPLPLVELIQKVSIYRYDLEQEQEKEEEEVFNHYKNNLTRRAHTLALALVELVPKLSCPPSPPG
jgi:hypothetical protein